MGTSDSSRENISRWSLHVGLKSSIIDHDVRMYLDSLDILCNQRILAFHPDIQADMLQLDIHDCSTI
jgi:hypothetical protein